MMPRYPLSSNAIQIRNDYERLWQNAKAQLTEGQIDPGPMPDDSSRRWGISAIIRPSQGIAAMFANVSAEIRQYVGPSQVIYDEPNLHTTVRSIEFHRTYVAHDDERVSGYAKILRSIAREFRPLRIHYAGLTADRRGVMAQGWPLGDDLQYFRECFHASLRTSGLLTGPEAEAIRETAHVSLVVFSNPLSDSQGLVKFVEQHRSTDYGISEASHVELVRYGRTETKANLVLLASICFGASQMPTN